MILICIRKVSAEPATVVCVHKLPHHMCRAQVFCGNIDCQLPILPATNFLGGKTQRGLGGFGQEVGRALREKLRKWKLTAVYPPFTSFSMGVGLAVVGVSRDSVDHRMLAPFLLLLLHRPCLSRCWHAKCQQISAPCPASAKHCTLTQFDFYYLLCAV